VEALTAEVGKLKNAVKALEEKTTASASLLKEVLIIIKYRNNVYIYILYYDKIYNYIYEYTHTHTHTHTHAHTHV
jgi:hypothetical protein